jgi:siroheme synthase-like protein
MKKRSQLSPYYPIFLNISGRRCVVIGGGQVARRKVGTLLEHRADVTVICADFCPELGELAEKGQVRLLHREYRTGDLKAAFMAIAATNDSDTNLKVAKEARRAGVLLNVVDDAGNSDFILPSYLRRGEVTIAVSTAGRSPALARKIRTRLAREFGDEYASLARLISEVRAEVKRQGIKVDGGAWQAALDLDLLSDLVRRGDHEKAKTILLSNLQPK